MTTEKHSAATYYTAEVGHEKQGPWTYDQVAAMVLEGRSTLATLWWRPGMQDWQRICTFPMPVPRYNPLNAAAACLRRGLTFTGRACRAEFWFYQLALVAIYAAICLIANLWDPPMFTMSALLSALNVVFVYVAISQLAAAARRLHDAGLSAWLLLLLIIPLLGWGIMALLLCLPPCNSANRHGPRPLLPDE